MKKSIIIFVLVTVAIFEVFGAGLYDEKEDAKTEIENKFQETEKNRKSVDDSIKNELKKTDEENKKKVLENESTTKAKVLGSFSKSVLETARTAVAKGKPLTTIECIGRIDSEGKILISDTSNKNLKAVENVQKNKTQKGEFDQYEIELIGAATEGLKNESLKKINDAKLGVEELKKDALKKIESAKKLIKDLELQMYKPFLSEEYQKLDKQIQDKFNEIEQTLIKRLQKCVV